MSNPTEGAPDAVGAPREFAELLQAARDGMAALAEAADQGHLEEITADLDLRPAVLAQLIMEGVSDPEGSRMTPRTKAYWIEVADHMGPDWIGGLRRAAAFMDKTESF